MILTFFRYIYNAVRSWPWFVLIFKVSLAGSHRKMESPGLDYSWVLAVNYFYSKIGSLQELPIFLPLSLHSQPAPQGAQQLRLLQRAGQPRALSGKLSLSQAASVFRQGALSPAAAPRCAARLTASLLRRELPLSLLPQTALDPLTLLLKRSREKVEFPAGIEIHHPLVEHYMVVQCLYPDFMFSGR